MWSEVLEFSWKHICASFMRFCFLQNSFSLASNKELNIFNIELAMQVVKSFEK